MLIKIRFKKIYLLAVILLCWSVWTISGDGDPTRQGRTVEAGDVTFTLPPIAAPLFKTIDGNLSFRIFGVMDERELCYFSYFAIIWSPNRIPDSVLVPTREYEVLSTSSSKVTLGNGRPASIIEMHLHAVKPCGKVMRDNLQTIVFYDNKSRRYYGVSAFIKPLLTQKQLLEAASSVKAECIGGKK